VLESTEKVRTHPVAFIAGFNFNAMELTRTRTRTHTHAHAHTHAHTRAHSHTHSHTHSLTLSLTHSHTHTHTHTHSHTHTHTHTHTHSLTHTLHRVRVVPSQLKSGAAKTDAEPSVENLNTITYELRRYLYDTPAGTQTAPVVVKFLNALNKYSLSRFEKLQLLNFRPCSEVLFLRLVEGGEERFSSEKIAEILDLVETTLPPPAEVGEDGAHAVAAASAGAHSAGGRRAASAGVYTRVHCFSDNNLHRCSPSRN
jgi:hypothetical protein